MSKDPVGMRADVDPENDEGRVDEIHVPSRFNSVEAFLAASGETEPGTPIYFRGVQVNLKGVNWTEVKRLRGEPEPTGLVAVIAKHVKRISGAFGL